MGLNDLSALDNGLFMGNGMIVLKLSDSVYLEYGPSIDLCFLAIQYEVDGHPSNHDEIE